VLITVRSVRNSININIKLLPKTNWMGPPPHAVSDVVEEASPPIKTPTSGSWVCALQVFGSVPVQVLGSAPVRRGETSSSRTTCLSRVR
jgi:hypothetical protein